MERLPRLGLHPRPDARGIAAPDGAVAPWWPVSGRDRSDTQRATKSSLWRSLGRSRAF
jgi:hypothetical protein